MRKNSILAGAVVLLAGCGGGGGGNGAAPDGQGTTNQFGAISTRGTINGVPVVQDLGSVSLVALAGTMVDATYRPQGLPDRETAIAVSKGSRIEMSLEDGDTLATWTPKYGGAELRVKDLQWYPDGSRVYFVAGGSIYYAAVTSPDTAVRVVNSGSVTKFRMSPDGTQLAYEKYVSAEGKTYVYLATISGTNERRLRNQAIDQRLYEWAGNDRLVARYGDEGTPLNVVNLSGNPTGGFSPSFTTVIGNSADARFFLSADTDGTGRYIVSEQYDNIFGKNEYDLALADPEQVDAQASLSPDGKRWVVAEYTRVSTMELYPQYLRVQRADEPTGFEGVSWQPALGVTQFVGSRGKLTSSAAGIIAANRTGYGRNGLASFVAWDAETRSTSQVSEDPSPPEAGAKTFVIEADRLTALKYANRPLFGAVSTVNSTGSVNGAIVTVDAADGTVVSIVVYQETRGAKVALRHEGTRRVIEGRIAGVWDARGENLAPNGASRVELSSDGIPFVG